MTRQIMFITLFTYDILEKSFWKVVYYLWSLHIRANLNTILPNILVQLRDWSEFVWSCTPQVSPSFNSVFPFEWKWSSIDLVSFEFVLNWLARLYRPVIYIRMASMFASHVSSRVRRVKQLECPIHSCAFVFETVLAIVWDHITHVR